MPLRLGPFDMDVPVGHGGMGVIWRGAHRELGTPVAAKVLTGERARSEDARRAFEAEARAVAGLSHPHIVRVMDYGVLPDAAAREGLDPGSPYLIMELAEGSLGDTTTTQVWSELRAILLALLDALAHAHARDVIHCDLKLSNVLYGGLRPGLKLSDFGIARVLGLDVALADTRQSAGTPSYMAPEQFTGTVNDLGPWTDLYSLGVLTWKLVRGRAPYRAAAFADLMAAHLLKPIPRLNPASSLPTELEDWVRWLLQKDPAHRCQRAADAAWALRQLPEPEAGEGGGPGQPVREDAVTLVWSAPELESRPTARKKASVAWPLPPLPMSWRRGSAPEDPPQLAGVGLGLFGVRAVALVGRAAERDRLWAALDEAGAGPRAVILRGPAGCGKTRLARWIGRRAHEVGAAAVVHATHGPQPGPADGLAAMGLRALRGVGLSWEDCRHRARQLEGVDEVQAEAMASLVAPDAPRPLAGARQRYVVLARLLAALAGKRRLVVVLDDLQWGADAAAFAAHLLEDPTTRALRVLVVGCERTPEDGSATERLTALGAETLDVGPLSREEQVDLVLRQLGLSPGLAAKVGRRSGGNPLWANQLLRDVVDGDQLVVGPKGYVLRDGADPLPTSLEALLERRFDRLADRVDTDDAATAVELAAVLGRDVQHGEWRAARDRLGLSGGDELVFALLDAGLVVGRPDGWSFAHLPLHAMLTLRARRRGYWARWHANCAEVVEDPERRGLHLLEAGAHLRAAEDLLRGASLRDVAGEPDRSRALIAMADAALDAAGAPPSHPLRGIAALHLGRLVRYHGRLDEATERLRVLVASARANGWSILPAALTDLATMLQHRGSFASALQIAREAVAAARDGAHDDKVNAAKVVGDARIRAALIAMDAQQPDEAIQEAAALYGEANRNPVVAGYAATLLAKAAQQRSDHAAAVTWCERALDIFRGDGDRVSVIDALLFLGEAHYLADDLDAAEQSFRDALHLARLLGTWNASLLEVNLGLVALARGQTRQARRVFEAALPVFERERRVHFEGCVHAFLLPCVAEAGEWERFDDHLEAAVELLGRTGFADRDIPRLVGRAADEARRQGQLPRALAAKALAASQRKLLGL